MKHPHQKNDKHQAAMAKQIAKIQANARRAMIRADNWSDSYNDSAERISALEHEVWKLKREKEEKERTELFERLLKENTFPTVEETLSAAAKLSIQTNKPIDMHYFLEVVQDKAFLAKEKNTNARFLCVSEDEHSSDIVKIIKSGNEYILMSEATIYITPSTLKQRLVEIGYGFSYDE